MHSHVLVHVLALLHIVAPHLPDDANLVCHVLDESLEEVVRVRAHNSLNPRPGAAGGDSAGSLEEEQRL